VDTNRKCLYFSEIAEQHGRPLFRVICEDDKAHPFTANAATAAWTQVVNKINSLKEKKTGTAVSGPFMYGISHPVVVQLLERLPNAVNCKKYHFKYFDPKSDAVDKPIVLHSYKQARRPTATANGESEPVRRRIRRKKDESSDESDNLNQAFDKSESEASAARSANSDDISLHSEDSCSNSDNEEARKKKQTSQWQRKMEMLRKKNLVPVKQAEKKDQNGEEAPYEHEDQLSMKKKKQRENESEDADQPQSDERKLPKKLAVESSDRPVASLYPAGVLDEDAAVLDPFVNAPGITFRIETSSHSNSNIEELMDDFYGRSN